MNKILLIPGSFNPITNAHVDMALAAKKAVNVYRIFYPGARYICRKEENINSGIL